MVDPAVGGQPAVEAEAEVVAEADSEVVAGAGVEVGIEVEQCKSSTHW